MIRKNYWVHTAKRSHDVAFTNVQIQIISHTPIGESIKVGLKKRRVEKAMNFADTFRSSAYKRNLLCRKTSDKSLIKRLKSNGPRWDP